MDGEAPEPIEVELTAHEHLPERGGSRWRRDPDPGGVGEPDGDERTDQPDPPRSDRSRLVTVAAVAAVLALVLGWVLGRATTGSESVADDASGSTQVTTTVATPLATLPIVGDEIDGADFGEPPVEEPVDTGRTDVGPTTTEMAEVAEVAEVAEPTIEPIAVDQRVAGVPVRLVGVELGGVLVEVDLAAGTLTDFRESRLASDGNPLVIGPDWVASTGNGRSRLIRSDGTDTTVDLGGDYWRLLHVTGTELFWRSSSGDPSSNGGELELVDLDGEPVGPTIELPVNAWPYLVDPASGGVVVSAAGRSYAVTPDSVEQLATGEIAGMSPELLVTYGCDAALVCSLYRTDRVTGEVVAVPPDPDLAEPYQWASMAGWGGADSGTLSPDGRWVAVIGSSWRASVAGIVELRTGRFVEFSQLSSPPTVVWSPDSRWAFSLDDQVVTAYDTVTGDRFPVFTDVVPAWIQLGARPPVVGTPKAGAEGATLLRVVPGTTRHTTRDASASPEEVVEG